MGPRLEIDPSDERAELVKLDSVGWRIGASERITVLAKSTLQLSALGPGPPIAPEPFERDTAEVAPVLPHAQLTLVGHAYAPRGSTRGMVQTRVALLRGATTVLDKTVLVYGDRATPADLPRHFQVMPLVHERAPAGPWNPVGRNLARGDAPPNLVPATPSHPIACFARMPGSWPSRAALLAAGGVRSMGTPEVTFGLFDFRYFLDAPFDQWLPTLEGDETLVLEGLSPHVPRMSTDLPSWTVQAAWWHPQGGGGTVVMRLDCISLDVDRGVASLVWRGHFGLPLGASSADASVRVSFGSTPPSLAMIAAAPAAPEPAPAEVEDPTSRMKTLDPALFDEDSLETTMAVDEVDLARSAATPFGPSRPRAEGAAVPPRETLAELRASTVAVTTPATGLDQTLPLGAMKLPKAIPPPLAVPAMVAPIPGPSPSAPALATSDPSPKASGAPVSSSALDDLVAGRLSNEAIRTTSFAGADLRGAELAGRDLRGADLRGAIFESAKLRGSRLDDAQLEGASFVGADLESASLEGAKLAGADLTRANLRSSRLARADLTRVKLVEATLDGAILEGADLTEAQAAGANLERAILRRAKLVRARLSGANLRGANLESVTADGVILEGADLTKSRAERARAAGANLAGARLDDAEWAHALLEGANLRGAFLVRATVTHATLARADLSSADLREASLRGANLRGAICEGTIFDRADLRGVDLSGAAIDEKSLAKARTAGLKRG